MAGGLGPWVIHQWEIEPSVDTPYGLGYYCQANGAIADYDIVVVDGLGASGLPRATPADADTETLTRGRLGVAVGGGATTDKVLVVPWRIERARDTSTAGAANDAIYIGATAGEWAIAIPVAPAFQREVGKVLSVNATTGVVLIDPTGVLGTDFVDVSLGDNLADALSFRQSTNFYLTFVSTDTSEAVRLRQPATVSDGITSGTNKRVGGVASSSSAASDTITGTTEVETNFDVNYTLPANSVRVGSVVKIHASGIHTATTGAETHDMMLKWGVVDLVEATGIDPADNNVFCFDLVMSVRTIGAGAGGSTVVGSGYFFSAAAIREDTAVPAAQCSGLFLGSAASSTAAVRTDADQVLACAIDRQAGAADADSVRLDQFIVEVIY